MNRLIDVIETKDRETASYLKSLVTEKMVYGKWRNGKLVKAIWSAEI